MTHEHNRPATRGIVARAAGWASQHRARVAVGWVVLLIAAMALSHAVGTRYINSLSLKGTDSQRAGDLLTHDFPAQAGDADQIVFNARHGGITDVAVRALVAPVLARVAALPHVTGVVSLYSAAGARAISPDRRVAFATVTFDGRANDLPVAAVNRVISVAEQARSAQLQVELGGPAIEHTQPPTLGAATIIGLLAAVIVLLVTFGSLVAAGMPIVTALLGLGTAFGLAGLSSQLVDTPDFSTQLAALIGLGVGIDYALFIVTRFRDNYREGAKVQAAIAGAMDTAGRSVLLAGATVIIALLGLFALGVSLLYGVAVSAALAVLCTMLAALTMLPVLLSRFGERIGRSQRTRSPGAGGAHGRFWPRWTALVQRHPEGGLIAGLAIMLTLAAPAVALRLGASDARNDPGATTTRKAYDLLAHGFGRGFNGPLQVVAQLPNANDPTLLAHIAATLRTTPDVATVSPPRISQTGNTAVFSVYPDSAPQSQATTDLVQNLRTTLLPTVARSTGTRLLVGGEEAMSIDFTHVLSDKLPLFIGVILALSALLLLGVFRSLVIPIQAIVMNLLSVGAALGVIVAIFQWGWLGSVFNINGGPIEAYIPVVMFAIVFGLSMDYEIFLVSRIHEAWTRRPDASSAVYDGFASTGRVITAAATIMLVVFLSFVTGEQRVVKVFGLALASAVFLDAFVVRSLLLPSLLQLLGPRTWWLPAILERHLPHVAIDAPTGTSTRLQGSREHALEDATG
jgi:RND superfamily putative drug exporter